MASKIRVLSEQTINQIAAGEVIENPASVVKELVENSLDAGSSEICVEIMGGGRQLIRISDNGCGMNPDDAVLCLERHATSKIRLVEDIHDIATMGFRGEAIPSIASISKFTLITRPHEPAEAPATLVIVDGGRLFKCCPAERSPGTTIEVKSLFFNVPVRKKFQKSPTSDANEILKIISILAMGNPGIKFKLINNQKTVFSATTPPSAEFLPNLEDRITLALGNEFRASLLSIEEKSADFGLIGFLGKPHYHRHNRSGQYLFINQRPVFSPLISNLVREGYGPTLPANRYPAYVLHLQIPGSLIDVNVHPQKREVRLRYEQPFRQAFIRAIEKQMRSQKQELEPFPWQAYQSQEFAPNIESPFSEPLAPSFPRFFDIEASIEQEISTDLQSIDNQSPHIAESTPITTTQFLAAPSFMMRSKPGSDISSSDSLPFEITKAVPQVVGTLTQYILAITEDEKESFLIYDQQLVHQRVLYEQLLKQQAVPQEAQALLIPLVLEFTAHEAATLREYLAELKALGIEIEELRPNTFILETIPTLFKAEKMAETIAQLIHQLNEFQGSNFLKMERNKKIALSASRASLSSHKRLTCQEAQGLIERLMLCAAPDHCPLGKSVKVVLNSDQIKNYF